MSNKSPAFQFYAGDFLVGTMGMSDEEVGVYIKMLAFQWERGSLPSDPKSIKKLINSKRIPSENVLEKFQKCDEKQIKNARLEKEREKQATFRESRVKNAIKRWEKGGNEDALASPVHEASICKTDALHSSSSSSSKSPIAPLPESLQSPADFDDDPPSPPRGNGEKISESSDKNPTTPQALRIAFLFNRRPSTAWSAKEIRAFKAIGKVDPEDLELVCRYTESERIKGDDGRHRRDLLTFLNNFPGELDRARAKPINGNSKTKTTSAADYGI